jgi:hypothetical protein
MLNTVLPIYRWLLTLGCSSIGLVTNDKVPNFESLSCNI